jgi:hypothetical protein
MSYSKYDRAHPFSGTYYSPHYFPMSANTHQQIFILATTTTSGQYVNFPNFERPSYH